MCCRYKEMSRMNDLISLSCSLNLLSASSKASSLICNRTIQDTRRIRTKLNHTRQVILCPRRTCGEIPVRCLRWLLTRLDFLMMECMLSLEILSMNVSSSPFLYFTTADSRGRAGHKSEMGKNKAEEMIRRPSSFFLTEIFPAFVLIDVDVDLLDGLQRLRQFQSVVVVLWRGSEQLHQQQRVAHDSLHRLDEERAQIDVVCLSPGRSPAGNTVRHFSSPGNKLGEKAKQLCPLTLPQNTLGFSCSLQNASGCHIIQI